MQAYDRHYRSEAFWSEDDQGYIAIAPDLPGTSAFGLTRAEAESELDIVIELWIEAQTAAGNPIPEPSARAYT